VKPVDTYKELLTYKPPSRRQRGRKWALDLLSSGYRLLHDQEKLFSRPRIQFLYIHHIFKDEEKKLVRLLESLGRHHRFAGYSESVDMILRGRIDKPYICLSSDDGLKNNTRAAAIMKEFGARACFFICPEIIGEKNFDKLAGFSRERLHFPPVEFMDWDEVLALRQQGHEIGAHTMSHINIAGSSSDIVEKEIEECYATLKERCGGGPLHFAWPYGRFSDFTGYARKLVFRTGYASCASASRGCHIANPGEEIRPADLLIRRDHVLLDWPLDHILYFIARNSAAASPGNNSYPPSCA
jgi:peptidoglycan/xylan/chitin deacetylase (PgdA/CDA1 family)